MMSIEYMNHLARQAARRSQAEHKEPLSLSGLGHDAIRDRMRQIPFLGKNRNDDPRAPRGWKIVKAPAPRAMGCSEGFLFVDSTGMGADDEPALTVSQFVQYVYDHPEFSYGIVESGQFQVVIAAYERVEKKRRAA